MPEVFAGKRTDFADDVRKIVANGTGEVSVFRVGERFYAFANRCLHQGGPVGEGRVFPKTEVVVDADGKVTGHRLSETERRLVCPWHGWEYDLETGKCAGDQSLRLQRYETTVRGDDVFVVIG